MILKIYIISYVSGNYQQYITDYSEICIKQSCIDCKDAHQIAIHRDGNLMYYTYLYKKDVSSIYGLSVVCGEVCLNLKWLYEYLQKMLEASANKGVLFNYDKRGQIQKNVANFATEAAEIDNIFRQIKGDLDRHPLFWDQLPPEDLSVPLASKISLVFNDDDKAKITEALRHYHNVVVTMENTSPSSFSQTVLRLNSEKEQLLAQKNRLEREIEALKRQKKQYRMVFFLFLAVAACLVALYSFNSNIQTLTGDLSQRNEEIKELNQDLLFANGKLDSMFIEIAEKDCVIGDLQKEVSHNNRSIDSLNNAIITQKNLINDLRTNLSSVNSKLSSTSNQLLTAKSSLEDEKRKLSNYQNKVRERFPLIINNIELSNYTKDRGRVISDYGKPIYSNKSRWIWFRINYDGMESGTKRLYYRIYDPEGDMMTCSTSPSGFSYSTQEYIYLGTNTSALFGWGSDSRGSWREGKYRIEIWYGDICLKSKAFTIL